MILRKVVSVDETELAQVLCEWDDEQKGRCRCAHLFADDNVRCKSPIGIARVLLAKYTISPRNPTVSPSKPA